MTTTNAADQPHARGVPVPIRFRFDMGEIVTGVNQLPPYPSRGMPKKAQIVGRRLTEYNHGYRLSYLIVNGERTMTTPEEVDEATLAPYPDAETARALEVEAARHDRNVTRAF